MALYRVMIHGRNFLLKLEGKGEKVGFYTPRFAEAPDAALAEEVALADFQQSQKFKELLKTALNSAGDPPVVRGEGITQAQDTDGKLAAGLVFYREPGD